MTSSATPFWLDGEDRQPFPALAEDLLLDVAIIGGGMVGLHCAWNLRGSGLRVGLFEARRIGRQATGKSTAKVTSQHGLRYASLRRDFGEEKARLHATGNERAVAEIAEICGQVEGGAGFERRDAYIFATDEAQRDQLEKEAEAARALGLPASIEALAEMPVPALALLRFTGQGQFDPYAYLQGLARLTAREIRIFEQSRIIEVEYGHPCRLSVNGHQVKAGQVVVATQMPIVNDGYFFAKAFPFAHPVAAAPLPSGIGIGGMFISSGQPSHSFRTAQRDGRTFLVAAGGEFRTGDAEEQERMIGDLRSFLRDNFGIAEPSHLWINEDFRPMDGAAFIGPATSSQSNLLVATGFEAWGITQGAVAGEVLAARLQGKPHEAAALYDATRVKPITGGPSFVTENLKTGAHLIGGRLLGGGSQKAEELRPGEGAVLSHGGEKLAVRRDAEGRLHAISAVCTHMGCIVDWNAIDGTWDCPCHGSRFDADGEVLAGPAMARLDPRQVDDWESGRS